MPLNMNVPSKALAQRLKSLESHLKAEHPDLLDMVPTYKVLDKSLYRLGLLSRDESLATRISWWPLVSILGTFSSGKSTFINHFLGEKLQSTGNQAVDDKFTVICYGPEGERHVLPGTALDADPRFPFYRMSNEIEKVASGEGKRIDSYLQLKTTSSDPLKGKIIIDSPGFDADDQRRSTLRLTNRIIDLSDLVLVFFDARHPEPGAMGDTLAHLVAEPLKRPDAGKFLYILNQIDTTAREDNPEEVVAAWQRAIAQAGLTSGSFFCIYNQEAAFPIEDAALRARYESKRDIDLGGIYKRLHGVEVERSYRIANVLKIVAGEVETDIVPALARAMEKWRRWVLTGDIFLATVLAAVAGGLFFATGSGPFMALGGWLRGLSGLGLGLAGLGLLAFASVGHFWVRKMMTRLIARTLSDRFGQAELDMKGAFLKNTRVYRSLFRTDPVGWGASAKKRLSEIKELSSAHVRKLNDLYTDPSGRIGTGDGEGEEDTPAS